MIYTQLSGLVKTQPNSRNNHLIPEAQLRSRRMLEAASNELTSAIKFYPKTVELYHRLSNGRTCSCTSRKVEDEIKSKEDEGLNLSDFILSFDGKLNPTLENCPICFGTSFVGGYNRVGGMLLTLDSTLSPNMSLVTRSSEPPFYFIPCNKRGTVSWEVTVPSYFSKVLDVAIKWKEEPKEWTFLLDGLEYSNSILESKKGEVVTFSIQMKEGTNINAGLYCIFIQLSIGESLIHADMPRITKAYTGEMNITDEPQSNLTINFDKSAGKLSTKDVVIDDLGYIWRILEIEEINPMDVNIGFTCQARICRDFESYFLLPSKIINKFYKHSYVFVS